MNFPLTFAVGLFLGATLGASPTDGAPAAAMPPPVSLPAPVQTVAFSPDLRLKHPRIFIKAGEVDALRQKLAQPAMASLWAGALRSIDYIAAETPPVAPRSEDEVRAIADRLPKIAFAWLITQDPKYLAGTRKWIAAIESYPVWATDIDLGASHMTFGMALAYDWLYDALSPAERVSMEAALVRHGRLLLDRSVRYPNSWWGAAYFQNHCWINHTGISTAAMALYDTNPAEMQGWLDYTRTRFETTYRHLGVDGSYHEGPAYLGYGAIWSLYYIESLRSVSGEDLGDMPLFKNLTRHLLDVTMPDGRNLGNFGDSDAIAWGPQDDGIYAWLTSRKKDGRAAWLWQKCRAGFAQKPPFNSPFAFLWTNPDVAPQPPDDLPTCGLYPDRGLVVFRNSWRDDAAVVSFLCGPPGGHHIVDQWATFPHAAPTFGHSHPDANSFLFFSDRQWRVGNPAGYTHQKDTSNENVWTVGDKGQRGGGLLWFEPASYFVPGIAQPHLVRVATSPAADYVIGEAAPAYEPEGKLISFRRHLLFVKGAKPYVVVYDRMKASEPRTWASYLHTFGEIQTNAPVASTGAFTSTTFQAAGAAPPTEQFARLSSVPELTSSYGAIFGPSGTKVETRPLKILSHPRNKWEERGFELVARPRGSSDVTWLVTVVGVEPGVPASYAASPGGCSVKVGDDLIAWKDTGEVALNGRTLDGNLLSKP